MNLNQIVECVDELFAAGFEPKICKGFIMVDDVCLDSPAEVTAFIYERT